VIACTCTCVRAFVRLNSTAPSISGSTGIASKYRYLNPPARDVKCSEYDVPDGLRA